MSHRRCEADSPLCTLQALEDTPLSVPLREGGRDPEPAPVAAGQLQRWEMGKMLGIHLS